MVILKKIIIMTEHGKSNCSGIVKFENFAGRTSCFVRILGLNGNGIMCMKNGDNVMYCGSLIDGEHKFNTIYDLNKPIQIVVVADGSIVCMGSNRGRFSPNAIMNDIHRYYANMSQAVENPIETNATVEQEAISQQQEEDIAVEEPIATPQVEQIVEQEAEESVNAMSEEQVVSDKRVSKTQTAEPFYKKIQNNLNQLFETHEKDEELTLLIPDSKWVRVPIEGDGYYVVGVIENDSVPDIICYGVPDKDNTNPPQNSSDCRQWMEIEKGGRGYWMMYQSAVSGATLTTTVM